MCKQEIENIIKIINIAANVTLGFGILVLCGALLGACSANAETQGFISSGTMTVGGLIAFVMSVISWAFIKAIAYVVEFLAIQTDTMYAIYKTMGGDMSNLENSGYTESYSDDALPPID
ncbi:MAG: hypothetical protein ACLTBR_03205 [Anaerostipes sp.]|uniref:hypothetical protein n=1 Tax=Anaerostipes sp. TaxID=1872530 RepID=UPI003992DB7B